MSDITNNLTSILQSLPAEVTLVAVSKTHPSEAIIEAYETGHRIFGENKVQELAKKYEDLPKDIKWHMIGHLQRNKVKYIVPFVELIHGVDSFKLLREIDKQAGKINRKQPCLLQIHIAKESSKFGLDRNELFEILNAVSEKSLPNVKIKGLMGMATFTQDKHVIRSEFRYLKTLFDESLAFLSGSDKDNFTVLSMGMSGDYPIAIEEGSTMVRIGSGIFGSRT